MAIRRRRALEPWQTQLLEREREWEKAKARLRRVRISIALTWGALAVFWGVVLWLVYR